MVYEDKTAVAFMDVNPVTPGHLLELDPHRDLGDPVASWR
jgi:diadenosine tetraphosphate (Ap4A) HIT family hydrolase